MGQKVRESGYQKIRVSEDQDKGIPATSVCNVERFNHFLIFKDP